MKTEWYAPLAAAFCLMLAYGSSVQPDGERGPDASDRQNGRINVKASTSQPGICKASEVIGRGVHSTQGEKLGEIKDVVFDPDKASSILYVVMSFGGFLGVGEKFFAVPWEELALAEDGHSFLLGVPREAFEKARGFDEKSEWPLMADNR